MSALDMLDDPDALRSMSAEKIAALIDAAVDGANSSDGDGDDDDVAACALPVDIAAKRAPRGAQGATATYAPLYVRRTLEARATVADVARIRDELRAGAQEAPADALLRIVSTDDEGGLGFVAAGLGREPLPRVCALDVACETLEDATVDALVRVVAVLPNVRALVVRYDSCGAGRTNESAQAFAVRLRAIARSLPALERFCVMPPDDAPLSRVAPFTVDALHEMCLAAPNLVVVGGVVCTGGRWEHASPARLMGGHPPVLLHIAGGDSWHIQTLLRKLHHTGSAAAHVVVHIGRASEHTDSFGMLQRTVRGSDRYALTMYWTSAVIAGERPIDATAILWEDVPDGTAALFESGDAYDACYNATRRIPAYPRKRQARLNQCTVELETAAPGTAPATVAGAFCRAALTTAAAARAFTAAMRDAGAMLTARACAEIDAYACATAPGFGGSINDSDRRDHLLHAVALRLCGRILPLCPGGNKATCAFMRFACAVYGPLNGELCLCAAEMDELVRRMCCAGVCVPVLQVTAERTRRGDHEPVPGSDNVQLVVRTNDGASHTLPDSAYSGSVVVAALAAQVRAKRALQPDAAVVVEYRAGPGVTQEIVSMVDTCNNFGIVGSPDARFAQCVKALALAAALDCTCATVTSLFDCAVDTMQRCGRTIPQASDGMLDDDDDDDGDGDGDGEYDSNADPFPVYRGFASNPLLPVGEGQADTTQSAVAAARHLRQAVLHRTRRMVYEPPMYVATLERRVGDGRLVGDLHDAAAAASTRGERMRAVGADDRAAMAARLRAEATMRTSGVHEIAAASSQLRAATRVPQGDLADMLIRLADARRRRQ